MAGGRPLLLGLLLAGAGASLELEAEEATGRLVPVSGDLALGGADLLMAFVIALPVLVAVLIGQYWLALLGII